MGLPEKPADLNIKGGIIKIMMGGNKKKLHVCVH